jgi:hypothetical protein
MFHLKMEVKYSSEKLVDFNGFRGAIFQTPELFMVTAALTPDPTVSVF